MPPTDVFYKWSSGLYDFILITVGCSDDGEVVDSCGEVGNVDSVIGECCLFLPSVGGEETDGRDISPIGVEVNDIFGRVRIY